MYRLLGTAVRESPRMTPGRFDQRFTPSTARIGSEY